MVLSESQDPERCYYMLMGNHGETDKINLNGTEIKSSNGEKCLTCSFLENEALMPTCVRKHGKTSVFSQE